MVWNQSCTCISPFFSQLVPKGKGNVFANTLLLPIKLPCIRDTNLELSREELSFSPRYAAVSINTEKSIALCTLWKLRVPWPPNCSRKLSLGHEIFKLQKTDNHENANKIPQKYFTKSVKSLQSNCGVLTVLLVSIKILQIPITVFSTQSNFWAVNSSTFHFSTLRPKC